MIHFASTQFAVFSVVWWSLLVGVLSGCVDGKGLHGITMGGQKRLENSGSIDEKEEVVEEEV